MGPPGSPPTPTPQTALLSGSPAENANNGMIAGGSGGGGGIAMTKVKKKTGGARLWMRFDRLGRSELVELDKNAIIRHAAIPTRDLRILGPVFSHSSNILGN